ncbi:pyridine nucleotide-disulfide oxidoreductase domain-containing protein 2 [Eurytemora carolleeae]|uniref:pyridine nucleotide-disulfide oxidoreductase domain-containing protein 2 n=1 Tax=Eurytemora carolleeae TaxID=1294199 RepID=UPI000C75C5C6|nr:pyridine nucleotide-disulfide oxidoreductase domain-containing protein 2 [Eurytemora carolleeae]|eukprot:XP_023322264.1 pyridine nucleotide-disulfide oxidoreductase domain-containing protein 2-like [Eurytemora affinis]
MIKCPRKIQVPRYLLYSTLRRGLSSGVPRDSYDVVVVGGGHNGLVSAAYLAKAGLKTTVLERRHVVGGAAVTEEIVPGFKFSRASYVLSLLRPQIFQDLELTKHGLKVHLRDPSSYTPIRPDLLKDGDPTSLTLGLCEKKNKLEISKFSVKDAENFSKYEEELEKFVEAVDPLLDFAAIDMKTFSKASLFEKIGILRQNLHLLKAGKTVGPVAGDFYELMTAPTTKILDKWFESEPLKATLATDSCIGAMISPDTPGSGYVLLHHVMGELEGIRGAWGYPEGGMGAVSGAIAKSALAAGAEIYTSTEVEKITTNSKGEANGVILADGSQIKAKLILSNATPEITFNKLMKESSDVPCVMLPNFLADPNQGDEPMPHHRCTIHMNCEESEMINVAYQDAVEGRFSKAPMIEMTLPSSLDKTISPPGSHVCLLFTQYAPYQLKDRVWDEETKEEYANIVFDSIEQYAPGFKSSIVGKEVLPPPDLERIFGLTGGNIFHGSMSLDQLYLTRPTTQGVSPGTPVPNLLICGSGAHPGGGVMGAPGRIAAKDAVKKLGGKWEFS